MSYHLDSEDPLKHDNIQQRLVQQFQDVMGLVKVLQLHLYLTLFFEQSYNLGFGGQSFIERTTDKVKELKAMIDSHGCSTLIEIDGGVNAQNAVDLRQAGADVVVAGNFVFKHNNPLEAIEQIFNI